MNKRHTAILKETVAMLLFGSIGLFVKYIPLQSSLIALARAVIGMLFLFLVLKLRKQTLNTQAVKKNLLWLLLSGTFLGFNWICLFEAYRYTSVAVSTLCYYMAPTLIILATPIFLKEKLSGRKILCVLAALCGMVCISGVLRSESLQRSEWKGIVFGLAGAVLYAAIILSNKQLKDIHAYDRTVVQLAISAVVLLPYCIITYAPPKEELTMLSFLLLLIVGVVHTGVTYFLYFGAVGDLSGQSAAIISYVDPLVAVLLSATLLKEPFHTTEAVGTLLILGAAFISELPGKKSKHTETFGD